MQKTFEPRGWKLLRAQGADAVDFLHRVTTADVAGLGVGSGCFGFLLRATGRVVQFFHVTRTAEGAWLATPDADGLIAELTKLHFREDFELSIAAGRRVIFGWEGSLGSMQLVAEMEIPISDSLFSDLRVAEAFPWMGSEISDQVTPVEINGLFAVSRDKGCYPGQEVIEKMLGGRIPRQLVRLTGDEAERAAPGTFQVTTRHSSDGSVLAMVRRRS